MKKLICSLAALFILIAASGQVTEKRDVSGFTGIEATSTFNITLQKGDTESLTITADEELMPYIRSEVKNGVLRLYIKKNWNMMRHIKSPVVKLTMKDLTSVDLSGACTLESNDIFEPENFKCDLSGASNLRLKLHTGNMDFDMSGASKVTLEAKAKKAMFDVSGVSKIKLDLQANIVDFDVSGASNIIINGKAGERALFDVSGASKINAFDFPAKRMEVEVSGTSKVDVYATDALTIDVSGMSTVTYKGKPTLRLVETSGMSKIRQVD